MSEKIFDPRCLRYVSLLRQGDYARCADIIRSTAEKKSPEWAYLHILVPSVFLVGELFVQGEITGPDSALLVAEVYKTMELARTRLNRRPPLGLRAYATFMPGFAHNIGFISIRHWLERDGWSLIIRDPVPEEKLLAQDILDSKPDILAISCSLPRHVVGARRVIRTVKAANSTLPIWIGGLPLNVIPGLFEKTGADHTAKNIITFTRQLAEIFHYQTLTPKELVAPGDPSPAEQAFPLRPPQS